MNKRGLYSQGVKEDVVLCDIFFAFPKSVVFICNLLYNNRIGYRGVLCRNKPKMLRADAKESRGMKKVFMISGIIIFAIIVGIFVITTREKDTKVTEKTTKVGVVFNGEKEDRNWCQSHYEGLEDTATQLNLELIYREWVTVDTVNGVIDELVVDGCEIIVANSFEFAEGMEYAAEKYPEIYFFHATGVGAGKNLSSYFGRMYQVRYLTGIVAGMQTETKRIGYVAAFPIAEVNRGINAFTLGVRSVNPEAEVYVCWTNSWNDDAAAERSAERLIDEYGVDVLAMHTDSVKPLDVAERCGVMSIGYNVDNSEYYPNTFLTAAVWDWESFYTPHILTCLQEKFEGHHYWEGIETGMVSMALLSQTVKDVVREKTEAERQRLISGTFDVFYGPIRDNKGRIRVAEGESMTDDTMLNQFDWYVEGVVLDEE